MGDGEIAVIDRNAPLKIVTLDNHDAKIDIKKLQLSHLAAGKGRLSRISCSRRFTSSPGPS